jgi:hypothetical protein
MAEQSYQNHARYVPMFHFVLFGALVLTFIGSLVNLYHSMDDHSRLYSASLIAVLSLCAIVQFFFSRIFPLKAQDRAIFVQESLRHYVLTGKPLDPRITVPQTIGLRFASDEEFPALARRAAEEGLSLGDIKKAVKKWRPDNYRV